VKFRDCAAAVIGEWVNSPAWWETAVKFRDCAAAVIGEWVNSPHRQSECRQASWVDRAVLLPISSGRGSTLVPAKGAW